MNAPPLLKEELPRLPWPAVANHRVPILDPTCGAPGPPPPPVSPVGPPLHPIGHLEEHLAGQRRVTWWWVSLISPVSPISPPVPQGPHSRVATSRLPLPRGGGLPGFILAPGTPLLTPRVPFLLTPLVTPHLTPLVTPLPLVATLVPLVIPVIRVVPVVPLSQGLLEVGFRLLPVAEEELPAPGRCPPLSPASSSSSSPPSPLDPYVTTHHSPRSNSSSQSPNTVLWLKAPP